VDRSARVGIVGAGRLGASLGAALRDAGYQVVVVASRSESAARALASALGPGVQAIASVEEAAAHCDAVFLSVPDGEIAAVAASLRPSPGQVVVHCSGALGLDVLAPVRAAGAVPGCFHPLQSFPSREPEPWRFRDIVCGVEAASEAGAFLEQVARDLGARPVRLEGVDRALYHAAAVFASNHLVALAAAAARLWAAAGLPPGEGRRALSPLLLAAARNVAEQDFARALTGPIARGDTATVARHFAALSGDPGLRELYRRLSLELLRLPLGHSAETLAELRRVLGEP